MINAPSAGENPAFAASITIRRQSAIEIISISSSLISFFVSRRNEGKRKIPAINHKARTKTSFKTEINIASPANCWLTASVESKTSKRIATRSCTIRTPNTRPTNFLFLSPSSLKDLMIMVVEEMDRIPPRKILSMVAQPSILPVKYPAASMNITSKTAVTEAGAPTFISFLKLNSNPRLNRRNITPISAQI
jgi:hypothetical protein